MRNQDILLTVIVPIYNAEKYLVNCIESISKQTYKNLEILLIDDGSTDGSGKICDEYAVIDERIRVLHKPNEGLVAARKLGVGLAAGEVIAFVDSDDWIEKDMYQEMLAAYRSEKADLVTSGLIKEKKDLGCVYMLDGVGVGVFEREDIENYILANMTFDDKMEKQGITASVCNKLFKKKILDNVLKNINSHLTFGEDGVAVYSYIINANRIVVLNKSWYHYLQHNDSMVHAYDINSFSQILSLQKCMAESFKACAKDEGKYRLLESQINNYVKSFVYYGVKSVYGIDFRYLGYLFPYESVEKGCRIVIYGAGAVGQSFVKCIEDETYVKMVAWVDRNCSRFNSMGMNVKHPGSIIDLQYDYVVIAIADMEVKQEIEKELMEYGVDRNKIIWNKYKRII